MIEQGTAVEQNHEIIYDIWDANNYVTKRMRGMVDERASDMNISINSDDLRVLYAPREVIESNGHYISKSGRSCQYCIGGPRVDYNRSHDLVQIGVPSNPRMR